VGRGKQQATPVVLVIDDEDYVADMIASALEVEGYTVHVAYNGRSGLELAQEHVPDLVIIDIMMPYMSGVALIGELHNLEHTQQTPAILISAGARPREPLRDVRFLPKPFDMDRLLDMVATDLAARGSS
jgi:CheY-like chemotaxis protein